MNSAAEITKDDLVQIIRNMYHKIEENKSYLSKLDTEIGDGDHGFSIASGFRSVNEKIDEFSKEGIGDFLRKCGFEIIKVVGGASGAVFGTFFTGQASFYKNHLNDKQSLNLGDVTGMLGEALEQIKNRGNAQVGDKTMVDALDPAVKELEKCTAEKLSFPQAFQRAFERAKEGAESTKNMIAKRGRSKNVGERSIGYIDPGSMSMTLLLQTMAEYFQQ
jgi:dihydroxyacetone kinase-like protein